jgi:hypothetical protein
VRDAQVDGDEELAGFFREAAQQSDTLASRAEGLLAKRLTTDGTP